MASIQLSGSVGSGGSFAILGFANVEIVGNANLTLSLAQYSNLFIQVTSDGTSSGIKNVVVPLNEGTAFIVENKTSEGFAIQVIGPSGTGVTVASGASTLVYTDGTNYISLGSSTVVASVTATGPLASTGGTTPNITIAAATDAAAGSMSAADKTKLDGLSATPVDSVTGSNGIASSGGQTPNVTWAGLGDIGSSGLVDAISGPSPIPITPAVLQFAQATVAPTISQAQQDNASAPQSLTLAPQPPGAAATNATNGTPGSVVVSLPVPVTGGSEGALSIVRAGGASTFLGPVPAAPQFSGIWLGLTSAPTTGNFTIAGGASLLDLCPALNGSNKGVVVVLPGAGAIATLSTGFGGGALGSGTSINGGSFAFGGGSVVAGLSNATTEPTANVAAQTTFWAFTNGAWKWRSANGWQGNLAAVGAGSLNTQQPFEDTFSAVVRTVSSATPTAFPAYTCPFPALNTIGWINVRLKSKAATTGTGIAVGDGAFAEYRLGYKNIAGTVTLSTAGLTLLGAVQTTAAALTSTLTAAAAGGTVVFSVTNVNLATIDSQIDCTIDVC